MDAVTVTDTEDVVRQERDSRFDPFLFARSEEARGLVADVLTQLQNFETHSSARRRKRRPRDQYVFQRTVGTIVANLVARYLVDKTGWVAVPFSKDVLGRAGRYSSPVMNKTIPTIIRRLSTPDVAFVEMEKGTQGFFGDGRQTRIRAGSRLVSRIETLQLGLDDFTEDPEQEVIVLKRSKGGVFDKGKWIDYEDTEQTNLYRSQLRRINAWLAEADIWLDPDISDEKNVSDGDRLLRRYFNNGSFEQGGRLFGGFWQALSKTQRREGIEIEGESTVTLDYAQMAPRILYGLAGAEPPEGDAYAIPGWEGWRSGVKKIFNALLFADKMPSRFPRYTRNLFPEQAKIGWVTDSIQKHHEPIRHLLCSNVGFTVLFQESCILVDVLLKLMDENVVALPVHDALIVKKSVVPLAKTAMQDMFKQHTGTDGRVEVEP